MKFKKTSMSIVVLLLFSFITGSCAWVAPVPVGPSSIEEERSIRSSEVTKEESGSPKPVTEESNLQKLVLTSETEGILGRYELTFQEDSNAYLLNTILFLDEEKKEQEIQLPKEMNLHIDKIVPALNRYEAASLDDFIAEEKDFSYSIEATLQNGQIINVLADINKDTPRDYADLFEKIYNNIAIHFDNIELAYQIEEATPIPSPITRLFVKSGTSSVETTREFLQKEDGLYFISEKFNCGDHLTYPPLLLTAEQEERFRSSVVQRVEIPEEEKSLQIPALPYQYTYYGYELDLAGGYYLHSGYSFADGNSYDIVKLPSHDELLEEAISLCEQGEQTIVAS